MHSAASYTLQRMRQKTGNSFIHSFYLTQAA